MSKLLFLVHGGYSGVFSLQTPSEYCIVLVSIIGIYLVSILWVLKEIGHTGRQRIPT